MSKAFTTKLVEMVRSYRERAQQANVKSLSLMIEAKGRVDGDLLISFRFSEPYGDVYVEGNTLEDVFREFLRRKGWKQEHQPLCLPNVEGGDTQSDSVYRDED